MVNVPLPAIFRHIWIMFVLVTLVNVLFFYLAAKFRFSKKPDLLATANRLLLGAAFWANLPWLLMGLGIETGQVSDMIQFFHAASTNPYVRLWFWMMAALFALGTVWMFWWGGGESVSKVAIEINPLMSAKVVRWAWVGLVAWNLVCGTLMFQDFLGFGMGPKSSAVAGDPPGFLVFLPLVFIVMFIGISFLASFFGGWRPLSKEYRFDGQFEGETFRFESGNLGGTRYNSCLTFGVGLQGLYLDVLFFFKFGHPPLLFPWKDIEVEEGKVLWIKSVFLTLKKVPAVRLGITRRLALKLKAQPWASEVFKDIV